MVKIAVSALRTGQGNERVANITFIILIIISLVVCLYRDLDLRCSRSLK